MAKRKKYLIGLFCVLCMILAVTAHYLFDPWGFYWKVSDEEAAFRLVVTEHAERYLGCREADGSHKKIIDLYNSHMPLAQGYAVQYSDSWCATFVSAIAIETQRTDVIPTECSCERQIQLFQELGHWDERDTAIPLPGDLIYYNWEGMPFQETSGWSDHVGIVMGTKWPFVKVIEGNKDDCVAYRVILLGDPTIRGYARPDYASIVPDSGR